ncbi:MAG TPA: PEGA domain-containing protein [Gammaproteobacteria bacterium]|nr:PEGA domain-containing protein [Gammaproteobacteria bacterium]
MLLAIPLFLLQACGTFSQNPGQADSGKKGRVITVTSNPAGATVRANGNKLGATPLQIDIEKSFSRRWVTAEDYGVVYRLQGELSIEKSGCDDYTVPVTETAPADDISVTLACTEQAQAAPPAAPAKTALPETMEQRLKKLEKLYQDGAISADEYKQHRNRILGEL